MRSSISSSFLEPSRMLFLLDDSHIREQLIEKSVEAFENVFRLYSGSCLSLSRKILGDESKANDVVQTVFVDLYKYPEKIDPSRGSIRTYLLTKTHSKSIDLIRSEKIRREYENKKSTSEKVQGKHIELSIEEVIDNLSLSEPMKQALEQLNSLEREALILSYYQGYTYREAAKLLNEPEGTIKSRIRSALKKIKKSIHDFVPEGAK
ncbi:MAG: sigma-70 family RNA polymerase sigma factor [Acidimicrobiia bacterium]